MAYMKTYFYSCFLLGSFICFPSFSQNNNIGIGTLTPAPSALLDIDASAGNNKGMLVPRLTAVQRIAIPSPANSLLVFDIDSACFFYFNAVTSSWKSLCNSGTVGGIGSTGSTGINGSTGLLGSMGFTGNTGSSGSTGNIGITGFTGSTGKVGTTGISGSTGDVGQIGQTGSTGITGATGELGSTGTTGLIGTTGASGLIGSTGSTGEDLGTHWTISGNAGTSSATNFIGTTDPIDLVVKTNNSERMRILANGNVGIGTTVPDAKLDIRSSVGDPDTTLKVIRNFNGEVYKTAAFIGGIDASKANSGIYVMQKDNSSFSSINSYILNVVNNGTSQMLVNGVGNVGIGTTTPGNTLTVASGSSQFPSAISVLPSTHATSRRAGLILDDWLFDQDILGTGTKDFSLYQVSNAAHRLYFSTNGNVGIGTTTPAVKLHIADQGPVEFRLSPGSPGISGLNTAAIRLTGENFGTTEGFLINYTNDGDTYIDNIYNDPIITKPAIRFRTATDGTPINAMTLTHNGNVGIGTTAPSSLLHSAGQISSGIPFGGQGGALANNGSLLFYNAANTNTLNIRSGVTFVSHSLTLPAAQGTPFSFLQNDGAGNLSWANVSNAGWLTTGDTGTTPSTAPLGSAVNNNFIGTKDTKDFVVATNNLERFRVTSGGKIGMGTVNPTRQLTVYNDAAAIFSSSGTNNNSYYVGSTPVLAVSTDGNNASLSGAYLNNPLFIVGRGGGINGPTEEFLRVNLNGFVGINTSSPAYTLDVCGDIRATGSIYYDGSCGAMDGSAYSKPDFVFRPEYTSYTLAEVEKFIKQKGHLPWLTSAKKEENDHKGTVNITRMSFETLEAVENMQLQILEQQKLIVEMQKQIDMLKKK